MAIKIISIKIDTIGFFQPELFEPNRVPRDYMNRIIFNHNWPKQNCFNSSYIRKDYTILNFIDSAELVPQKDKYNITDRERTHRIEVIYNFM